MPDRAALVAQASPIVVERLSLSETLQHVVADVGVSVEPGNVMPHGLLLTVAERLVIGSVGPEDGPVASDPMAPNHSIAELIDHMPFRSDARACRLPDADTCRARGFRIGDLDDIRARLATVPIVQRDRDGHRLAPLQG
jgi:hypothetical protein